LGVDRYAEVENERRDALQRRRLLLAATLVVRSDHRERHGRAGRERSRRANDHQDACPGAHTVPIILGAWPVTASLPSRSAPRGPTSAWRGPALGWLWTFGWVG